MFVIQCVSIIEYIVLGGPNQGSVLGTEHLVHLLRKYSLHDNDRQTILSQEDSLNLVQLCLAEQNRKVQYICQGSQISILCFVLI